APPGPGVRDGIWTKGTTGPVEWPTGLVTRPPGLPGISPPQSMVVPDGPYVQPDAPAARDGTALAIHAATTVARIIRILCMGPTVAVWVSYRSHSRRSPRESDSGALDRCLFA